MRVAILSMFANSTHFLPRYIKQLDKLIREAPQHSFEPVLGEGDSTDGEATWRWLNDAFPNCVHKCVHGGELFYPRSPDDPKRWSQLSIAWNQLLPHVRHEHEAAVQIESDLIWEPRSIVRLLDRLKEVHAVSGLCIWANHPERHPCCKCSTPDLQHLYDWWGVRAGGDRKFSVCHPYHPIFSSPSPNGLYRLDSAGSVLAMRGEVARRCRWQPLEQAMCGFSHDIRAHGYGLWIDPKVTVTHP